MELINETPFASHLFRGVVEEDLIHATVVVRSTYQIDGRDGPAPVSPPVPVRVQPQEVDGVPIDDDGAPVKAGVDVCVFGAVHSTRGPVREMTVNLQVGDLKRSIRVVGDRQWVPRSGVNFERAVQQARTGHKDPTALVSTSPSPFEVMPMSWKHAFGGEAPVEGGRIAYAPNPFGRGYMEGLDNAPGTELPNLEDPDHPVRQWSDMPQPVCFAACPRASKIRVDRGVAVEAERRSFELLPAYFNVAHPWLVFDGIGPDTPIRVEGMSPGPAFSTRVPRASMAVEVRVADRGSVLPLRVDTVEIYPAERRFALVSRAAFRYRLRPGEDRMVRVIETRGGIG